MQGHVLILHCILSALHCCYCKTFYATMHRLLSQGRTYTADVGTKSSLRETTKCNIAISHAWDVTVTHTLLFASAFYTIFRRHRKTNDPNTPKRIQTRQNHRLLRPFWDIDFDWLVIFLPCLGSIVLGHFG